MPTWRARGAHPLSVTLRVAASSAPSVAARAESSLVLVGSDARADTDHHVGPGQRLEVVVAALTEEPNPTERRHRPGDRGGAAAVGICRRQREDTGRTVTMLVGCGW